MSFTPLNLRIKLSQYVLGAFVMVLLYGLLNPVPLSPCVSPLNLTNTTTFANSPIALAACIGPVINELPIIPTVFSAIFLSYHLYRVLLDGYSNKFMTAWTEPKRSYSFNAISICSFVYIYFTPLGVQEYVLTSYSHLSIIIFQAKIYNFQCL